MFKNHTFQKESTCEMYQILLDRPTGFLWRLLPNVYTVNCHCASMAT